MIQCRLCRTSDPHVHENDERCKPALMAPIGFRFAPSRVSGIDFALPAIRLSGQWWIVSQRILEVAWMAFRRRRFGKPSQLAIAEDNDEGDGQEEPQ